MNDTTVASATTGSQSDIFDALWRFFSSVKLALGLILVIAFTSLVGSFIPQAPGEVLANALEYHRWLDMVRSRYGSLTDLFSLMGLFNVYSVWWFKILLLGLVFNTIICTVNRLPSVLQPIGTPKIKMGDSLFKNAKIRASFKPKGAPGKDSAALDSLVQVLSKKNYKVFIETEGDTKHLFADRYGIFKLGTIVTHTSIVVLLVGTVMGGMFGFSDDGVVIPEGKTYAVGFGENFQVRADKFVAEFWEDGRPKDYYSDLTVIENGREVLTQRIRVNEPLEYRGVRFHQAFYGPVATLEVRDSVGTVLFSDDLPLSGSSGPNSVGFTSLPAGDIVLVASLPQGDGPGQLGIQLFRGDSQFARGVVRSGQSQDVGGYAVTFKGLKQFTGLRVVKDPGVPIVWLASGMLVIGVCLTLYFPRRRLWARVSPREVALAGTADRMVNFRDEFDRLVDEIRAQEAHVQHSRKRGG